MKLTPDLRAEYSELFARCNSKNALCRARIIYYSSRLTLNRPRYSLIEGKLGVPWYFVGLVHLLESGLDFRTHLHNGDPLTARTVHEPKGCPMSGKPPFTWEDSAIDALQMKGLRLWSDWSVVGVLFQLERYNGFGYRKRGIPSPYLWGGSNLEQPGKYVADGVFDPFATTKQIGAGTLFKAMTWAGVLD